MGEITTATEQFAEPGQRKEDLLADEGDLCDVEASFIVVKVKFGGIHEGGRFKLD